MVGDALPTNHPGHSQSGLLKVWVARSDKYAPGKYQLKSRCDSGLWELVAVSQGRLTVITTCHRRCRVLRAGEYVFLPPRILRAWELPSDQDEARGFTLLYRR